MLIVLLAGCRGSHPVVTAPQEHTAVVHHYHRDSISTDHFHTINLQGDTVRIYDSTCVHHYHIIHDSTHVRDSIPYLDQSALDAAVQSASSEAVAQFKAKRIFLEAVASVPLIVLTAVGNIAIIIKRKKQPRPQ